MTGIKERITKKTGHVRQNLMGKRCDKTARTVVGPDPTLKLNEVAVPEEIANMLTIPEHVTHLSIAKLTELVTHPVRLQEEPRMSRFPQVIVGHVTT